ncbi:MAG: hypothetical protein GXZ07_05905 [Firmicutes bacterium]|nr:hypothetical protein [Bacillota bacterium]
MKKLCLFALICLIIVSLTGCREDGGLRVPPQGGEPTEMALETSNYEDEAAVTRLVKDFGGKLKDVSLLASAEELTASLEEHYGEFVTSALLESWQNDPQQAPGRVSSSPWPELIEVVSLEKSAEGVYEVQGKVIEMTSVEMTQGGIAAQRPITLTVEKSAGRWLISALTLGAYADKEGTGDADTKENARSYDDEGKLLLGDTLSFGLTYEEVKAQFPEVGPLQAEGGLHSLGERGLKEAVLITEVLGHTAELEFNFEMDQLYSFYYSITLEDEAEAEKLYSYLQNFYAAALGPFSTEEQEEGGISSTTGYWQNEAYQFGLTHQVNADGLHFVSWGWE